MNYERHRAGEALVLAAVERVTGDQLGPQRLGDHAVHGAAVEPEAAAVEQSEPRVTEVEHVRDPTASRGPTPASWFVVVVKTV